MTFQRVQQTIQLQQIDWNDSRFRMSRFAELAGLRQSIMTIGIINPPVVVATTAGQYCIVCGWRRLTIWRELKHDTAEVLLAPATVPALELFNWALFENLSVRNFNLIEKAEIVARLQTEFAVPDVMLRQIYLPALAVADNPRWRRWLPALLLLPEAVQRAFAEDLLSLDLIDYFTALSESDQHLLLRWITGLRLGKNQQKELILLLGDLLRREQWTLAELFAQSELQQLEQAEKLTPSQKCARLFEWLKSRRLPNLTRMENQFQKLVHSLELPGIMQLRRSPYFEGDWFEIGFRFRSPSEFAAAAEIVHKLSTSGAVQVLKELTEA